MHRAANTIDFLTDRSSGLGFADFEIPASAGKLLNNIIASRLFDISSSRALFTQLAHTSIRVAEHAYCLRDWNSIQEASVILMNLPIPEMQQVGLYYQANVRYRRGEKAEVENQCEELIDNAPYLYRARATQALGMVKREQGELDEALRLNLEALRMTSTEQGKNLLTSLRASWEIGLIKSLNGDHKRVIEDLERDWPLIRLLAKQNSYFYYVYHADIAYELAQVGRIVEAEAAINIALASRFARAYPEWSETRDEIAQKRNYPDLSRCSIASSRTEAEALLNSASNLASEADAALEHKRETEVRVVRVSIDPQIVGQSVYQRPVTLPNAVKAIILGGSAKSFLLQRLGRCLQPRAPPAP